MEASMQNRIAYDPYAWQPRSPRRRASRDGSLRRVLGLESVVD